MCEMPITCFNIIQLKQTFVLMTCLVTSVTDLEMTLNFANKFDLYR